jgi:nitrous oxide reductase accessory protein NosL
MFFKNIVLLVALITLISPLNAQSFTKKASEKPQLLQKGNAKKWCPVCGMSLKMFYKTSHAVQLHNHEEKQYCSMRCLVVDMEKHNIDMKDIEVVDVKSEKFINASTAFYVVGSSVKGTMSRVSKLAFKKREDAQMFVKKHGGKVMTFQEALSLAKKSLSSDIAMVNKKKEKKIYPIGEKIYKKKCKGAIDVTRYKAINELKAAIVQDKICKSLKPKQLQALSLYLWEKRGVKDGKTLKSIKVTKDEKCPVCGMFVYKYPRWAAQIFYTDKHYSFDGVKDLMKYYFSYQDKLNKIKEILVTDYYTQGVLDARDAFFVVGSDVYGPMGAELIPFKTKSDAETFYMDHKGKKVLGFKEITSQVLQKLDK